MELPNVKSKLKKLKKESVTIEEPVHCMEVTQTPEKTTEAGDRSLTQSSVKEKGSCI